MARSLLTVPVEDIDCRSRARRAAKYPVGEVSDF